MSQTQVQTWTPHQKREFIQATPAYGEWWYHRRRAGSIPQDPYRAYMIDIGIVAHLERRREWRKAPQWSDVPDVDRPQPFPWVAPRKRHVPSRKEEARGRERERKRLEAPEMMPSTKLETEILGRVESWSRSMNVPVPEVEFQRGRYYSWKRSRYISGWGRMMGAGTLIGTGRKPLIQLGIGSGKAPTQIRATAAHEFGHHVAYFQSYTEGTGLSPQAKQFIEKATRIEHERKAWDIARRVFTEKKPEARWIQRLAIGTYLGNVNLG